ncbi:homeobox domain protein [Necator americanus]|uniref:Homeobox domain protein n=1 Tax=Necator americanus TaxID=51031 RepID=W2TDP0_NECAM|nr:homeobox domain protein [Necator americanus]ETN79943.1 homeobox domain protein [Necator americanus]
MGGTSTDRRFVCYSDPSSQHSPPSPGMTTESITFNHILGQIGGNPRSKISVQSIEKQLMVNYEENPKLCAAELRQLLIEQDSDGKSSSSDDDSFSPSESRRNRTSFTAEQLETLENAFKANTYPDAAERESIARRTGLTEEKIMVG